MFNSLTLHTPSLYDSSERGRCVLFLPSQSLRLIKQHRHGGIMVRTMSRDINQDGTEGVKPRNAADPPERAYKTFTVGIDETMDRTIDELKEKFGKTSRADVFRLGIALLKVAAEAKERHLKLTVSDENDVVRKEIVIS